MFTFLSGLIAFFFFFQLEQECVIHDFPQEDGSGQGSHIGFKDKIFHKRTSENPAFSFLLFRTLFVGKKKKEKKKSCQWISLGNVKIQFFFFLKKQ